MTMPMPTKTIERIVPAAAVVPVAPGYRRHAAAALAAALLALAGCTTLAPAYQQPESAVPSTFPAAAATATAAQQRLMPAETPWQDYFTDARLRKLIAIALENNRDLRVAVLQIEKARAAYRIQRAALLPTLSAGGSGTATRTPAGLSSSGAATVSHEYTATLGTSSYELDLFGRVRSLKDAALASYLNTEAARRAAQITLVANVASAYLAWASDRALERLAQGTLASQQASYEITRGSAALGTASAVDVKQAEQSVAAAQGDVARYAAQVAQDENALALLLGAPVPVELAPPAGVEAVTAVAAGKEIDAGLPSTVLLARPDVVEAEQTLRGADADIGAARAALFPTITLTAAGGTASAGLSSLFKAGTGYWSFAPSVNLPIFDGGALRASLESAKVAQRIAVAQYQKAVQNAFKEVADALAVRATMADRRTAQQRLVASAQAAYELSLARYRAGVESYTTVLTSQRSWYSAQQDDISLQLAWQDNLVTLYQVLGGGA
ncbi:efflux transporter outer membrane subunit [Cupriavidus malaysiensis]|uniref:efflux transporter outer membrane subunit n=1 Tax=Cupriavidus malaysiensis TaxID=367825 RepID=UPI000B129EC4|nr:efflux transporter outer membrane subunit [Cupriavidus malaysiensis]